MSDPYERAKTGRLTFKGGSLGTLKSIDKKKHKKNKKHKPSKEENPSDEIEIVPGDSVVEPDGDGETSAVAGGGGGDIYTIDAAKRLRRKLIVIVNKPKEGSFWNGSWL
ncbi:hypothetical protein MKW98_006903 [Papaver atlanticum]|uniref:Uncharacterized protein n=1 Tax=Papaver atlanticum TaxID=357466 RepID=A0AAD4SUU1_9MAGN|nr:hypothetical protein MKW98_006903 [Papaver atlanticum]